MDDKSYFKALIDEIETIIDIPFIVSLAVVLYLFSIAVYDPPIGANLTVPDYQIYPDYLREADTTPYYLVIFGILFVRGGIYCLALWARRGDNVD